VNHLLEIGLTNAAIATGLAIVAAGAAKFGARPMVVHGLWLLVLLKLVTPPLISLPVAVIPTANEAADSQSMKTPAACWHEESPLRESPDAAQAPASETLSAEPQVAWPLLVRCEHWLGQNWKATVFWAWLTGSMCWFMISATRVVRFHRLVSRTEGASNEWIQQVDSLAARFGLRACPNVRVTEAAISPMVWTLGNRATLLLPRTLFERLGSVERATLLSHELAHIRRGDPYVRWFEAIILGLYWWHPIAWLACRAVQDAAEQCCDDWVLRILPGSGRSYANTLLETADFLTETPCALPLGASGFGRTYPLSRRIEMVMEGRTYRRWSKCTCVIAALAVGAVLSVSPVFMQGGEPPLPPDTKSKPRSSEASPASAEASAKTSAARRIVVVDVQYLFKHHEGFRQSMESLKKRAASAAERTKQQRAEITDLRRQIEETQAGTPQRTAIETKIIAKQSELNAFIQSTKKELLDQQKENYQNTWNDISAVIAQYAKQHDIDLVLRVRDFTGSSQPHDVNKNMDANELLSRMNAPVVYQSSAAHGDEIDITREVLAGLGHAASGPEKSAK
jgi:bla regulator protein BlaR1